MAARPGLPDAAGRSLAERRAARHTTPLIPDPDDANRIIRIPVDNLAPHPDNPRGDDLGDLTGLAASITEVGVQQPVTAVPRHLYLADHPEHADLIPAPTKYVILMGHRRHAATRLAGLPDVPVIVRTDPATIGRDLIAMAVENLHRLDLTPIQEARAYAQLRDLGLPQREIGRRVGVSQTKVSRLLSLLELPPAAQQDVARGTLPVAEALDMLRGGNAPKPAPATTPAPDVPPPTAAPRPTPAARPAAATAPAVVDRAVAAATVATGNLPRQNYLAAALAAAVLRSAGPGSLELAHQWLTPGHPALASSTPAAWARAVADTGAAPGLTRAAWAVAVAADELAGQPGPREDAHRARLAVAGWVDANRITGGTP